MLLNSLNFMVLKITAVSLLCPHAFFKEILNILTLNLSMKLLIY